MSASSAQQPLPSTLPVSGMEGMHLPPRYSTLSLATLPAYPAAGELDISRAGHGDTVSKQAFDFCLQTKASGGDGKGRAWATLRLFSMVPASLQRPRYTGGENIDGVVLLNLKRPQTIISVSVVLRGQMVTSSRLDGAHTFLEIVTPIWDNKMPPPTSGASSSSRASGKLHGRVAWPFSIPFPAEFPDSFAANGKRKGQRSQDDTRAMHSTPQTICQRGINANIHYEVTLKINTSGLLNAKHRTTATVLYVPTIRAPPIPPLRASAYVNGSFLIGPEDDPTGWQALPSFHVRVAPKLGQSTCDLECIVYIANPTTYTRGSVIPCYLLCKTSHTDDDSKALMHAFTAQNCLSLDLSQRVQYHEDPRVATPLTIGSVKTGQGLTKHERTQNIDEGGTAVWWTPRCLGKGDVSRPDQGPANLSELTLEGELHIDVGLLPTCNVPFLEVSHQVQVSLKDSQDLLITKVGAEALPSWNIKIATVDSPTGPAPAAFTPRPPRKKRDLSTVQDVQYQTAGAFMG